MESASWLMVLFLFTLLLICILLMGTALVISIFYTSALAFLIIFCIEQAPIEATITLEAKILCILVNLKLYTDTDSILF
jgi:hypothetical protein